MTYIRPAVLGDVETLIETTRAAYVGYLDQMGRRPAPMDADFVSDISAGHVWVVDGEPAAITMFADRDDWHIASIAVDPSRQGRGLGRSLMAHAEIVAAERGHQTITLYTHVVMTGPARLYPMIGYSETGRMTVDGYDRIYFEKVLSSR